jgi:uroporphyrinogen decarboxylase
VVSYSSEHGFLFMRLFYLRGFANLMADMASGDPRLERLIERIVGYWEATFRPYIEAGIDVLSVADDLGTQTASMVGPAHFRRWLLPAYRRLFEPARRAGAQVAMHHDGYVMDIMDEIIASGVTIVNPQDLVNGVDNLAREAKGRVCIRIDIDRQQVLPHGSPGDVRDLVAQEVRKLGSPQGGLEMVVGIYPPTPLENVEALFTALEAYRTYWVGR